MTVRGENYKLQLQDVQYKTGIPNVLIIQSVENKEFVFGGSVMYDAAGPKEFIRLLKSAKFVCTDSFHATALCINFSIDFVEFVRFNHDDLKSQNSRIQDLLEHYHLEHRLYDGKCTKWSEPIHYSEIQSILEYDREISYRFLIKSIGNE